MKKLFFLALLVGVAVCSSFEGKSQATFSQTASNSTGTITNAGIDTMTYTLTKGYGRHIISATITRASGTAAGTAILEYKVASADNYKADAGDTLTVANAASQTLNWNKTVSARYWRIRIGGATSVSATATAHLQTQ